MCLLNVYLLKCVNQLIWIASKIRLVYLIIYFIDQKGTFLVSKPFCQKSLYTIMIAFTNSLNQLIYNLY